MFILSVGMESEQSAVETVRVCYPCNPSRRVCSAGTAGDETTTERGQRDRDMSDQTRAILGMF